MQPQAQKLRAAMAKCTAPGSPATKQAAKQALRKLWDRPVQVMLGVARDKAAVWELLSSEAAEAAGAGPSRPSGDRGGSSQPQQAEAGEEGAHQGSSGPTAAAAGMDEDTEQALIAAFVGSVPAKTGRKRGQPEPEARGAGDQSSRPQRNTRPPAWLLQVQASTPTRHRRSGSSKKAVEAEEAEGEGVVAAAAAGSSRGSGGGAAKEGGEGGGGDGEDWDWDGMGTQPVDALQVAGPGSAGGVEPATVPWVAGAGAGMVRLGLGSASSPAQGSGGQAVQMGRRRLIFSP